jgi:hypothetical protein
MEFSFLSGQIKLFANTLQTIGLKRRLELLKMVSCAKELIIAFFSLIWIRFSGL